MNKIIARRMRKTNIYTPVKRCSTEKTEVICGLYIDKCGDIGFFIGIQS